MRLVVATDGSPHAKKAVEYAARLTRELRETEILLVTVGHIPALAMADPGMPVLDITPLVEATERAGQQILEEAMAGFAGVTVPVKRIYRNGDPSIQIIEAATEAKADLIVVGARGLGQVGGLILGSVSERVLHGSSIPVLVVR